MNKQGFVNESTLIITSLLQAMDSNFRGVVFKDEKDKILCLLDNVVYRAENLRERIKNEYEEDKCQ